MFLLRLFILAILSNLFSINVLQGQHIPLDFVGTYSGDLLLKDSSKIKMELDIHPYSDSSLNFSITYIKPNGDRDTRPYVLVYGERGVYLDENNGIILDMYETDSGLGVLYGVNLNFYLITYDFAYDKCEFSLRMFENSGLFQVGKIDESSMINSYAQVINQTAVLYKINRD
jgi:hypothetical protein